MAFIAGHNTQDVGTLNCGANTVYLNNAIGDHDDSTGYLSGNHQTLTNGLHAWVKAGWGTAYYKMAIYEDTGTLSTCVKVAESDEVSTTSTAWVTLDFDVGNVTLEDGKRYICGIIARHSSGTTTNCKLAFGYDDVANTEDGYFLNVGSYAFPDDLTGFTLISDRYNIWFEYEEASSGPTTYSGIHTTDSYITVPRQYTRPFQDITFTNWYNSSGILGMPELVSKDAWTNQSTVLISASGYWDENSFAYGDDWDFILWGAFSLNIIKFNNQYNLYYQGSEGYVGAPEWTVSGRAVGVATSNNGIDFIKYENNPIAAYRPTPHFEEGTTSWAPVVSGTDLIVFWGGNYYTGMSGDNAQVSSDVNYFTSSDGINFTTPSGLVFSRTNTNFFGYGDELFPVAAFINEDLYHLYYTCNGATISTSTGKLALARGTSPTTIASGVQVFTNTGGAVFSFGPMSYVKASETDYYMFVSAGAINTNSANADWGSPEGGWRRVDVYRMNISDPYTFIGPLDRYELRNTHLTFSGVISDGTILCDLDNNVWRLYYRNNNTISGIYGNIGMMTAPITYNTGHNKISDEAIHDSTYIYYGF